MRRWLLIAVAALAACGDDKSSNQGPKDAGADAQVVDAAPDAAPDASARGFCLDKPGSIDRAPTAGLPCELYPPSSK